MIFVRVPNQPAGMCVETGHRIAEALDANGKPWAFTAYRSGGVDPHCLGTFPLKPDAVQACIADVPRGAKTA